ncbi:hypothetical protein BXZ70DRAFT_949116 [Cristinia sonorae]|uniref:RRM Nup35-type domain-containing protein n=1 Tax=Cristinia sonorae TaxID=1940300 RepID=A0A8K0UJR5_9AGAR|nr:hypothetical protein BXZ70DRAFT_949116 [Cristinia sonorae]
MYSGSPFNNSQGTFQQQDQSRPPFAHSQSSFTHGQPFNVASMSNPAASHSSPSLRTSTMGSGASLNMNDSLAQSRNHYQSGYLMSVNQNNAPSQNGQRYDDPPLVPTKAKMNTLLSGSTASDFGMNSMFESSRERPRQNLADEDAPPTSSVNDIVNEVFPDSVSKRRLQQSVFDSPARSLFRPQQSQAQTPSTPKSAPPLTHTKPLQVIVFGYPPDKYTIAVEYFRAIGESTEPDANTEVVNCFRVGYTNPADALRAVRRNGEVVGGTWMVGVKWADQAMAESVLGPSLIRSPGILSSPDAIPSSPDVPMSTSPPPSSSTNGMFSSEIALRSNTPGTPSVGTPIRLAPSTSAFRKMPPGGSGMKAAEKVAPGGDGLYAPVPSFAQQNASPSKGIVGQVSDLIFGW